ncbi:MAG: MATE family efflux transporter [Salibacteraceae bacterium]
MTSSTNYPSLKNILNIATPLMISGFAMTIVSLTDTIFLSKLGEAELGGAGNAVLLFTAFMQLAMGFSTGAQIILSRRNGEHNYSEIGSILQHSILFMLALSVLIIVLIAGYIQDFTSIFVESESVRSIIHEYLETRSWGMIFVSFNVVFMAFYVGITKTRIIGIITPITAFVNILLDYGLIFGNLGLPQLGVEGAALASNLSEMVGTIIYIAFTLLVFDHTKYRIFNIHKINWNRYKSLLNISSPVMIQNFIALSGWFIFFSIIEHMGETELATSHIVRSIYMVLIIPVFGLGDATNSLTGNLMGENKSDKVWLLIKNAHLVGIGYCLLLQPLFYFWGEWLFMPFTDNPEVLLIGLPTMQVVFTVLFVFTSVIIGFRVISGAGKTGIGLIMESSTVFIYLICAWWISNLANVELYQVWTSEFIYFVLFLMMIFPYLKWGKWKETKV